MDWRICMGFCFIAMVIFVTWGARQGWYSAVTKCPPPHPPPVACPKVNARTTDQKVFDQSNELNAKNAVISDLQSKLQDLMNTINDLTMKNQQLEAENAQLRQALKNALDDLANCRGELNACKSKVLAQQITNQYCHMTPETANLLR